MDERTFKIHSGALKAWTEGDGSDKRFFLGGVASSTVEDRHGDRILSSAQVEMLDAARKLTMWLNHSYVVPEDILGTCQDSELSTEGEIIDLDIKLEVYKDNPRAMASWEAVNKGIKLGFSIGGRVLDFDWRDEDDVWNWSMDIKSIDLYEISLVGIPANPRAYVEDMAKSIRAARKSVDSLLVAKAKDDKLAREQLKAALLGKDAGMDPADPTATTETAPATETPSVTNDAPATETTETPATETPASESTETPSSESAPVENATTPEAVKAAVAEAQATLKTVSDELTAKQAALEAVNKQLADANAELATKTAERDDLQKQLDELRATPTGRKTATGFGSSTEQKIGYDLTRSSEQNLRTLGMKMAGVPSDPRSRAAG